MERRKLRLANRLVYEYLLKGRHVPLIIVSLKPIVTPILRAVNTSQAVTLDNSDFYEFTRLSAIINQFTNGNQV